MTTQIAQAWPGQYQGAFPLSENTAVLTGAGSGIMITASVAGTVTLTLLDGSTVVVSVPVGSTIYPFQVIKATVGTATITSYYNLIGAG